MLSAAPFLLGVVLMLAVAHFSDRAQHRKLFVWPFLMLSGAALFGSFAAAGSHFWLAYSSLIVAGGAMYAPYGPFFAIVPEMLPAHRGRRSDGAGEYLRRAGRIRRHLARGLAAGAHRKRARRISFDVDGADRCRSDYAVPAFDAGAHRIPRKLAINQPPDAERILIFQFVGQRGLGKILVADGPREAVDRIRAHRGRAAVAGGRIRPAMHHGVADFDAGGKAVHDEPSRLALQNRNQIGKRGQVALRSVQGRGQLAFERARQLQQFFAAVVTNHQRARTKDLRREFGLAQQVLGADLHHDRRGIASTGSVWRSLREGFHAALAARPRRNDSSSRFPRSAWASRAGLFHLQLSTRRRRCSRSHRAAEKPVPAWCRTGPRPA